MLEESVESFVLQWKPYAASVELFAHTEGSPLLEARVGDTILYVLERTGPYNSPVGRAELIINPVVETVKRAEAGRRRIEPTGLGKMRACGLVLVRERRFVVVDAGAPLVVGVLGSIPAEVALGDWLEFESLAPIHGFVVPPRRSETTSTSTESI